MASRIGVDVGGTFTDAIYYDDTSRAVRVAKVPTTPDAPEVGVMAAVRSVATGAALDSTTYFLHATTVGLNALIERVGAPVGLLSTRGFTDVLEIRRGASESPYNPFWKPPPPLVPRRLRLPVTERLSADGSILVPLQTSDIAAALAVFDGEQVESIAVIFLHSYANPVHELMARDELRRLGFAGEVSLSHEISGEYHEFERASTTVVDAYVRPRTSAYLRRLGAELAEAGFNGSSLMTRCGGGSITFTEAEQRPFETITSGPVAGAEGAAELARELGLGDVITADVGGTSFDTCLIVDGRPRVLYEGTVASMPLQTPWVDVRSIGSGGGSIAYVDVGGLLRVGPRSAGADPGPACYGRGGTEPTVTDAAVVLGMFGNRSVVSGVRLDAERARVALDRLARELGISLEDVARGIITIAAASMADAIREVTVEQGEDPRSAALVAFGGAGPLFSTLLARELEMSTVVVPPHPGNFSAWGLLGSDVTRTASRTHIAELSDAALRDVERVLMELFATLQARAPDLGPLAAVKEGALDMRYVGQEHAITVTVPYECDGIAASPEEINLSFARRYERAYGHIIDEAAEIVAIRATVRTPLPRKAPAPLDPSNLSEMPVEHVDAYSIASGAWMSFAVREREALRSGEELSGPAILLEGTGTTYLDTGFTGRIHDSGSLLISSRAER